MASKAVETRFTAADKVTPAFKAMEGGASKFSVAAKAAFRSVVPETSKLGMALSDITKGVVVGNLITKGITAAAGAIKNTIASIPEFAARADEIGKTAQKLGLTTDALQRYRFAAAHANVDTNVLNTAFQTMTKGLGSGALFKSLEKVDAGLAAQVKQAKSVDEAFKMITSAAAGYTDTSQRTAMMMAAFGKAGNQLVPMLGDLEEQMKAASLHGNMISQKDIDMAGKFNTLMTNTKFMLQSFADTARSAAMQYVIPLLEKFKTWATENKNQIVNTINSVFKVASKTVTWLIKAVSWLYKILSKLSPLIVSAAAGFVAYKTAATILGAVNAVMTALSASTAATAASTAAAGASAAAASGAYTKLASSVLMAKAAMAGLVAVAIAGFINLVKAIDSAGVQRFKNQVAKYNLTDEEYKAASEKARIILEDRGKKVTEKEDLLANLRYRRDAGDRSAAMNASISNLEIWLREHPRFTPEEALEIAAKEVADKREDPMAETNDLLADMLGKMDDQIGAINGLAEEKSNPMRARWGAMGVDDYWEIARLGV
jgi:hypothetical protein